MFPVFFNNRTGMMKFHISVLVYQMYHWHYASFEKLKQDKGIKDLKMNVRML